MASEWAAERRAGRLPLAPTTVLVLMYLSHVQQACCLSVWAEIYMPPVETSSASSTACASGGGTMAIVNCGRSCPYEYNPHANHMPARPLPVNGPWSAAPLVKLSSSWACGVSFLSRSTTLRAASTTFGSVKFGLSVSPLPCTVTAPNRWIRNLTPSNVLLGITNPYCLESPWPLVRERAALRKSSIVHAAAGSWRPGGSNRSLL